MLWQRRYLLIDISNAPSAADVVTIDDGVFGGSIGGEPFHGVGAGDGWKFTTKSAPASNTRLTVDDDGDADFRTLQGALNWLMQRCSTGSPATFKCNSPGGWVPSP